MQTGLAKSSGRADNEVGRWKRYRAFPTCGNCNISHRSVCKQHGNCGIDDADSCRNGFENGHASCAPSHAACICKQHGRNAYSYRNSPNLVIQDTLTGAGLKPLGFFSFLPVGVVCMAVGIVVMLPLCRMLLNKNKKNGVNGKGKSKTLDALVKEYRLNNGVSRYLIKKSSLVRGKSVAELDLRNRYGLSILEIRNEKSRQERTDKKCNPKHSKSRTGARG